MLLSAFVKAYVTNSIDSKIAVLNANTSTFLYYFTPSFESSSPISLRGIAISSDQSTAYVADSSFFDPQSGLWIINTIDDSVKTFVPLNINSNLGQVVVTPDGAKVYVADSLNGCVWVIHTTDNSVSTINISLAKPSGLAFNPSGTKLYITNSFPSDPPNIYVCQTSDDTLITTIEGVIAEFIAVNSMGIGYEPSSTGNNIFIFDTLTDMPVGNIITTGEDLEGVAFKKDGEIAYVASSFNNTLQILVNGDIQTSVTLTGRPFQVVINPVDENQIYCTAFNVDPLMVIYNGVQVPNSDFVSNLMGSTYLAYIVPALHPPSGFAGKVINNRFLMQTDVVHQLTWEASSSSNIVNYSVSRNGVQIAIVPASGPLLYEDHNREPNEVDFYEVRAMNSEGVQGDPASIYVP